jgi:hypothetical protein
MFGTGRIAKSILDGFSIAHLARRIRVGAIDEFFKGYLARWAFEIKDKHWVLNGKGSSIQKC